MLISKELNDGINAQIGHEFQASHQYVNVATYFDSQALPKLAQFFYKQAVEEREHAMKFVKYVVDAGGTVAIPAIPAPKATFATAEEVFEMAVNWEMEVTHNINNLMDIAVREKDYIAQQFLDWYTNEQLEEVSSMDQMLRIVRRAGERNLIMMEAYLIHAAED
jgi:bacterioferritin B